MKPITKGLLVRVASAAVAAGLFALLLRGLLTTGMFSREFELAGKSMEFLQPSWLYLICIVPFVFVIQWLSLTDVSRFQQYLASVFRSLLFAGLALTLARPVWRTTTNKIAVLALVDVSDSLSDQQLEEARKYIAALQAHAAEKDSLSVITFAKRPQVGKRKDGKIIIDRHPHQGTHTNIQSALQLAYGLYPDSALPRLVILSDGNQTAGDLALESYRARELGIKIFWQTFPNQRIQEIRVVGLSLPDEVKVGAPFEIGAEIWSTHQERVTLFLEQDDFPNPREPKKEILLKEGKNRVKFVSEARRTGFATYKLRLAPPKNDTNDQNNQVVMTTPVKGRPRILYAEGGLLRNRAIANHMKRALEHENIDVEIRGPRGLPSTAKELVPYDLVIVSDIPAHFLGLAQMAAIESYIRDFGGGFIMAGGEDSFGSGGYSGTRMAKILPLYLDSKKDIHQPTIAIVLVIDRSGSMQGSKIEAAKSSARATAEVLSPNDLIGVIGFDSQPTTVVRLQRAANRVRISSDISRLAAGGGTNIYPALQEAFHILQNINAQVKHVILLSDGHAPKDGIASLVSEMVSSRITVSAVGIGDAERSLLKMIVDKGKGRLYMTDVGSLPRIFMKETTEAKRSSLIEDQIKAIIAKRVEMIEGTGVDKAPYLGGYVSTQAKPRSEVILVSQRGEPLLARWRLGTGTVVAWTSDIKNRWAANWLTWPGYPKFWAQVVRATMRRKTYNSYDLSASVDNGMATVVVDAIDNLDRFVNHLDTDLEIIDPRDGKTQKKIAMVQSAAGRYQAEFRVTHYGSYLLKAVHKRKGNTVAKSTGAVSLSYPLEHLRSTPNPVPLEHAARVTGGKSRAAPSDLFAARDELVELKKDLWPWLLLVITGFLVADTYLKRVRLFGYRTNKF